MTPRVDFVSFDPAGVLTKEEWVASRLHCPRCGGGSGAVWVLMSEPPTRFQGQETRVFLCIRCKHTAIGLNGYEPRWDKAQRVQQIIEHGFAEDQK